MEFTLTKEGLSYYYHDLPWVCESGDLEIMIGPNSRIAITDFLGVGSQTELCSNSSNSDLEFF